jgi:TolA-binding protein
MAIDLDIHPDDLLHRARRQRALTRDEQLHLEAHLRDCATCRFVRDAGHAFDGEVTEAAPAYLQGLVDQTMQHLRAEPGHRRWPRPRRLAAGAVTFVVMIGGFAFAGYWGARHPPRAPDVVAPPAMTTPARSHRDAFAAANDVPPASSPPVDRGSAVGAAALASRDPALSRRRLALARQAADVDTAARLFAVANRARRRGDAAAAEAAYDTLWTNFRASREAVTSRAVAGQWMLDRGRSRAAIQLFQQYLAAAPTGELAEDVLVGLADAEEASGDPRAAAVTRRRLLAEHPGSVHAERARDGLRRSPSGAPP